MDTPAPKQNFMDFTNAILHPKKYFSHLYQGSVPELYNSSPQNGTQTCEPVHENRELTRPTKSQLGYRYGLSVGQLIERINNKVEVRKLNTSPVDSTCTIRSTSPQPERVHKPVTDIRTLLSDETDVGEFETKVEIPDSTMSCEGTQKKERCWSLGTQNPCQVCGDRAAGFYCGAFVCEACKKFFLRASRQMKVKYACQKARNCMITKESRVQCQYCRFQKCLALRMSAPGQKESVTKEESGISNIPCQVCNAPSSGFHFGALTCEGCKGFFRRIAKETGSKQFSCLKSQNCEVTSGTRNLCRACRYQKCIDIGMSIKASRIGRQPNSVRHAINLELQKAKSSSSSIVSSTNIDFKSLNNPGLDFTSASSSSGISIPGTEPDQVHGTKPDQISGSKDISLRIKQEPLNCDLEDKDGCQHRHATACDSALTPFPSPSISSKIQFDEVKRSMEDINKALVEVGWREAGSEEILTQCSHGRSTLWKVLSGIFNQKSEKLVAALKMFPVFKILELDDRVTLVQECVYSVMVLNLSRDFVLETKDYNFFGCTKSEEEKIMEFFPELITIREDLLYVGHLIKTVAFDDIEITCLTGLLTFNADMLNLEKRENAEEAQRYVMSFLEEYEESKFDNWELRFGMLVLRIGELIGLNRRHLATMAKVFQSYPDIEVSQLMKEMFQYNQ